MNIAVLIPSHVPFAKGGLEKHADELTKYGRKFTKHNFEQIVIPSPELSVTEVINSYKMWHSIELKQFDCVISLKYPTWICNHRNHILWMTSKLRGLYDLANPKLNSLISTETRLLIDNFINNFPVFPKDDKLEKICDEFVMFGEKHKRISGFEFPGYYIQKVVEYLDFCALSPLKISKFYTNSNNVKDREGYFYWKTQVEAIYPPLFVDKFEVEMCKSKKVTYDNYLLSVGRLSPEKRVDLTINAFKKTKLNQKLIICGDGPQKGYLRELAKEDKRISLLGYVTDRQKDRLYSNAKAIIFTPLDEDYGYITGEAFKYKKPVITTNDSGGVMELIDDGINGLVSGNSISEIAGSIERMLTGNDYEKMGEAGFKKIHEFTWENVIERIFELSDNTVSVKLKRKLFVLSTYKIFPAVNGGQIRAWNLYKNLADEFEVHFICLSDQINNGYGSIHEEQIMESVFQTVIVIDEVFKKKYWVMQAKNSKTPMFDVACLLYGSSLKSFLNYMEIKKSEIDIVVFCQPYLFSEKLLTVLNKNTKLLFEEQNLEWKLKSEFFSNKTITDAIKTTEERLVELCSLVSYASKDIGKAFSKNYKDKLVYLPNGFDFEKFKLVTNEDKLLLKKKLNIKNKVAIFVGSLHKPNIEAAKLVISLAERMLTENVSFVIAGSICQHFYDEKITLPKNILLVGMVTDEILYALLSVSDVALNPMFSGGGSNVKMMTYAAANVPTITSSIGNRDFDLVDGRDCLIADSLKDFEICIKRLLESSTLRKSISSKFYKNTRKIYHWERISVLLKKRLM